MQKPGVLTGVGVASVALGGLGLVMVCLGFFIAGVMGLAAMGGSGRGPVTISAGPQTVGEQSTVPPSSGAVAPGAAEPALATPPVGNFGDGLDEATSDSVASAMQRGHLLTEVQRKQLVALLKKSGKQIFPGGPVAEQPAAVHESVRENRAVPGAGAAGSALVFVVRTGEVDVYDDHAEFYPRGTDGVLSTEGISAKAVDAPAALPTTLPEFARVPATQYVPTPMKKAPALSRLMSDLMALDLGLSMLLAIWLLGAGILLLRNSRRAIGMHWIYALVRIPLVGLGVVSNVYFLSGASLVSSNGTVVTQSISPAAMMGTIGIAIGALIYPAVLIAVLRSRAVRDWAAASG